MHVRNSEATSSLYSIVHSYMKNAKTMCPALFFDFSILMGLKIWGGGGEKSASFTQFFLLIKLQRKKVHENARNKNCVKLSKPCILAGLHWTLCIPIPIMECPYLWLERYWYSSSILLIR